MSIDIAPQTATYDDLARYMTLMTGDEKHSSSATSTLDVLWVLYESVLRVDAARPTWLERDRFVLSKGHGPMAYYAVLAAKGFVPENWLTTFGHFDSPLGLHPDHMLIPGVEASSGSLGHGLPISLGIAVALRAKRNAARVFCLLGDAELDEGSNAEAIAVAPRLGLNGLTAIVVDNQSSSLAWPGGIARRFAVEGWSADTIDGRDHTALEAALNARRPAPHAVVCVVEQKR